MTPDQFVKLRDQALLSMDEQTIRTFARKYNQVELPDNPEVFWRAVHKARSAATTLPLVERERSIAWLKARGSMPWNDHG
jgi:hypothetical protein